MTEDYIGYAFQTSIVMMVSSTYRLCWTANYVFTKFHTVKNWYQFFTAREKMVPIRHIFHTNILHFVKIAHVVKLYVAYVRNLHIDTIEYPQICCILHSIPILHIYVRIL